MSGTHRITCPCCGTKLAVDARTGEILSEERPKVDTEATFEQAMSQVRGGSQRREEAFNKAFERTRNLDDLLQKKFDEARKKAEHDDSPPPKPFDYD